MRPKLGRIRGECECHNYVMSSITHECLYIVVCHLKSRLTALLYPAPVAPNQVEDRYRFLENLLALEVLSRSAHTSPGFSAFARMGVIPQLAARQDIGSFLRRGITQVFRIRVPPSSVLASVGSNSQSALSLASAVDKYRS